MLPHGEPDALELGVLLEGFEAVVAAAEAGGQGVPRYNGGDQACLAAA